MENKSNSIRFYFSDKAFDKEVGQEIKIRLFEGPIISPSILFLTQRHFSFRNLNVGFDI